MTGLFLLWGVVGSYQVVHPPRYRPVLTPGDFHLPFEELTLHTADGIEISGWFVRHPEPIGIVLLLHGFGTSKADLLDFAHAFAGAGRYHLFLIDFRGHGFSAGKQISFGRKEVLDVEAAARFCAEDPSLQQLPLACYGISMGGAIALLAAAREGSRIRAVAADSSYADLSRAIARAQRMTYHIPRIPFGQVVLWATEIRIGCRMRELSPIFSIEKVAPRPVLLIHGLEDRSIPSDETSRLFQAAREPKEMWLVPDAEHVACFHRNPALYLERLVGFFDHAF